MLDTVPDLATAINLMLARLDQPALSEDAIRAMVGKGMANLVRRALAAAQGSQPRSSDEARALAMYETDYERVLGRETVVFPGVREGLERLASAGFGLACVTNKSSRFARPLLAQAGLGAYFSLVVGGDSLEAKKPDPLPLQHAAGIRRRAGPLLMLGDSSNDTQAARAAGCPVLCVPYGYNEGGLCRTWM